MRRRLFACMLSIVLVIVVAFPAGAAKKTGDIDKHWARDSLLQLQELGILKGDGRGNLRPDAPITFAEIATVLNRTFGYTQASSRTLKDVSSQDWFEQEILRGIAQGYLQAEGNQANPRNAVTREQAIVMLAGIFRFEGSAEQLVQQAVDQGYVAGSGGQLNTSATITRAELAAMLVRFMGDLQRESKDYLGGTVKGNVTITQPDTSLSNVTIARDLYITEGVDAGQLTLSNVKVEGRIIVAGGSQVNLSGVQASTIIIDHPGTKLNLAPDATVDHLKVTSSAEITGQGKVKKATINVSGVTLEQKPDDIVLAPAIEATIAGVKVFGPPQTDPDSDTAYLLGQPNVKKPSEAGALKLITVNGKKTLGTASGKPIQLRGMSTHGLQWFPEIINKNAFATLANDWGSNVIRLAMYVGEEGYATNPSVKDKVIAGIDYAIANDLYVIVDWHVHQPGDPKAEVYAGAMDFFKDIATRYPNNPHILYELANEPNSGEPGVTNDAAGWQHVKSYAEPIIKMLRDRGNQNIVIVGSPNWSQRPDLAADDPIADDNTMYSVHFYSGTHLPNEYVMNNVKYALQHGVAVISTEWGTSEASGNNGPYIENADKWLNFFNYNNISWVNWSLTNKNETSAAFTPFELGKTEATDLDPGSDLQWSAKELSISGEYVRARIKGIKYEPIDRTKEDFSVVVWDFNDNTAQGFGVNGDSPIKDVTVTPSANKLKIGKLDSSSDLSEGNYWANVRISADGSTFRTDIQGADTITMDVIAATPAKVSIAAIPQSASNGWANPKRAVQVTEDDFVKQEDGSYKAVLTITKDDTQNLDNIATHDADNILTNIIMFVGVQGTTEIELDNITFSGTRSLVEAPILHDPVGTAKLPSDFEDATRQGWIWHGESGVKGALTIQEANGSKALSWETAYPEVKPSDGWASAPRVMLSEINTTRGNSKNLAFDFYIEPVRATAGQLKVQTVLVPPTMGYWAQAASTFDIPLNKLSTAKKTAEGFYHFEVTTDLNNFGDKTIASDTLLRDVIFIIVDDGSDFAGRMYIDNVRFE